MGVVYEVIHLETLARCALKVLLPNLVTSAELRARFQQEVMVTATIESDHIVKVFDGGTDEESGAPFLVMELLRGEDLAARVAQGPLPKDEVVVLLEQCALALERTHAAGVVHRDLKPANLFLTTRDDGSPCLKVLDYGIAKMVASASQAETTRALGTPLYMAPEQVKGDGAIGPAADLYALAQIAYTLLVGEAYWAADQGAIKNVYPLLMAIAAGTKDAASARAARVGVELPAAFDAWFSRATATEPEARFQGARRMTEDLARALGVVRSTPPTGAVDRRSTRPDVKAFTTGSITVGGLTNNATRAPRGRAVRMGTGVALVGGVALLAWSALNGSRAAGAAATPSPAAESATASAMKVAASSGRPRPFSAIPAPSALALATSATTNPSAPPRPRSALPSRSSVTSTAKVEPAPRSVSPRDPSDEYRKDADP